MSHYYHSGILHNENIGISILENRKAVPEQVETIFVNKNYYKDSRKNRLMFKGHLAFES